MVKWSHKAAHAPYSGALPRIKKLPASGHIRQITLPYKHVRTHYVSRAVKINAHLTRPPRIAISAVTARVARKAR